MRFTKLLAVIMIVCGAAATFAQTRVNVLWIGNSLTQGGWCTYEGWLQTAGFANDMTPTTDIEMASYAVLKGATSLTSHWSQGSGFAELDAPLVRPPNAFHLTESVAKYDYIVLQTYTKSNVASATAESIAICHYADLALSKGVKPVIFSCWDDTTKYDSLNRKFVNCYNKYKSRGALIAPLFDEHYAINKEKPVTYLYNAGDPYHHTTYNSSFLVMTTFLYLFTGVKPSAIDTGVFTHCALVDPVFSQMGYLAAKADAALSKYYDLGQTVALPRRELAVGTVRGISVPSMARYDIAGRRVVAAGHIGRLRIARSASGIGRLIVER